MVSTARFKDQEALVLESESLRAVILPAWGAKTVSLFHKGLGLETLWQNPAPTFTPTSYGADYAAGEFAGFDEMFPTISRCFYEEAPWAGVEAPDHGEVWTIPWRSEARGEEVALTVHGTRFPYRLTKTVSLREATLLAHYRAENLSPIPMDFIWAAHPLFNATPGMRFIVPTGMNRILNAVPGPTLGGYGLRYDFPRARRSDGQIVELDRVPPRNDRGYQKYWFDGPVTEGWCLLHDPQKRLNIGMSFPRETVPYLGMWLNDGGYAGQYNIAPEPATAAMDRIDFSRAWGMGSVMKPGVPFEWSLAITVAEGPLPAGLSPDGRLL